MKKWMTYTFGFIFTLIALGAVGMAGFRAGMMQSASFEKYAVQARQNGDTQPPNFDNNSRGGRGGFEMHGSRGGFNMRGGNHMGFGNFGFGGGMFFSPIFGLIRLAVLGLIGWFVYKWIKNSGWRLTKTPASDAPEQTSASE